MEFLLHIIMQLVTTNLQVQLEAKFPNVRFLWCPIGKQPNLMAGQ